MPIPRAMWSPGVTYFNEIDQFAGVWLTNLFPDSVVDGRSIHKVTGADTKIPVRVHLFAGIGGWELALKYAGWPDDRPVWTGSCPCQPFARGWDSQRRGEGDERHLWPEMLRLVAECRPPNVFGEQVASPAGRRWLAGVRRDMEDLGYRFGAADLCAAGIGAPHDRARLWWGASLPVEDAEGRRHQPPAAAGKEVENGSSNQNAGPTGQLQTRPQRPSRVGDWGSYRTVRCRDGFARRAEPGTLTVVDGFPSRVDLVRAYGNAIVPMLAAKFVTAFVAAEKDTHLR